LGKGAANEPAQSSGSSRDDGDATFEFHGFPFKKTF